MPIVYIMDGQYCNRHHDIDIQYTQNAPLKKRKGMIKMNLYVKRVTGTDSCARGRKPIKYRDHYIQYISGMGWVTDIEGDRNVYKNHYSAQNAVDAALGGYSRRGKPTEKRLSYGIQIIGQRKDGA